MAAAVALVDVLYAAAAHFGTSAGAGRRPVWRADVRRCAGESRSVVRRQVLTGRAYRQGKGSTGERAVDEIQRRVGRAVWNSEADAGKQVIAES